MINFWTPSAGRFTIDDYLLVRGAPLVGRFAIREYESIQPACEVSSAAHIFAAADQLSPMGKALLAELWDAIGAAAPTWRRLNDPRRVLLRHPFLDAMSAAGLNAFRAVPASDTDAALRYPVFLRERDQHDGPLTGLLDSPTAVRRAVRALRMRGYDVGELLQVEFQDTSDTDGHFRKYSAYRVGDAIIRTHLMYAASWSVKSDTNVPTLDAALEEREYLMGDAHDAWLRQVFDIARIDFGRIDYGVSDGRPQAWEINMNPTIGRRAGKRRDDVPADVQAIREEGRAHAHERLRAAFVALDAPDAGAASHTLHLPADLVAAVQKERRLAARRKRRMDLLRQAFHSDVIGWPARVVYGTMLRRG